MSLLEYDVVFLRDFVQFNWMQRVVTSYAFYEAGVRARVFALPPMRLYHPRKTDEERLAIIDQVGEATRVQSVLTARLFGEFFGALEDAGAFLRAIRERTSGGILANNLDYVPSQVRDFYKHVASARTGRDAWALLRFPDLRSLRSIRGQPLYVDTSNLYRLGGKNLREAADNYLRFPRSQLTCLNTGRVRRNWNRLVHILIALEDRGRHAQIPSRGLLEVTHNKIKHGFNVLESVPAYAKLRPKPRLQVVKIGRQQHHVVRMRENVGNLAMMCNRAAQVMLQLNDAGLWR
jgi:hypothetical protein